MMSVMRVNNVNKSVVLRHTKYAFMSSAFPYYLQIWNDMESKKFAYFGDTFMSLHHS